ncbi:MAG TPA: ABC transporter substrate-binding protein, partial [Candidatus Dormibacteraeota bacterium]|nr:ABC transporter substrate-binding protein [Candidatus Dormibacteraeota bacterium]
MKLSSAVLGLLLCCNAAASGARVQAPHSRQPNAPQPGVTANSITVGSLAPLQGENADTGSAVKAVVSAYFDDLNQRGGIYGRRIVLRFAESGDDSAATLKNARRLVATPVFAMVAPFVPGTEQKLAALA